MKKHLTFFLFFFVSLEVFPQCNPNSALLNEEFGVYGDTVPICDASFTFVSTTDTIITGGSSQITMYLDAFRIIEVDGLPQGVVLSTDVVGTADQNAPYGYWYNTGQVPSQSSILGCIGLSASNSTVASIVDGGPQGNGIYPFEVTIDFRVAQTSPDIQIFIPNGSWASSLGSFGIGPSSFDLYFDANSGIVLSTAQTDTTCIGGTIQFEVVGASLPLDYSINNNGAFTAGSTLFSFSDFQSGVNTITGVDDDGCVFQNSFVVEQRPNTISVAFSQIDTTCLGGDVELNLIESVSPITYSLNNGNPVTSSANSILLSALSSGSYSFGGVDSEGCDFENTFTVDSLEPFGTESICIVSVDSVSGSNVISWEKTLGVNTDYFIVYKQNPMTSDYDSIGSVDISSLSIFEDLLSNPQQNSDRYRISVVDLCGNESGLSSPHSTIHLTANQGINGEVNLAWSAYEGFSYPNFEIYRSNNGNPFTLISNVANSSYSYTDLNPPTGVNFYRVSVVNPNGCVPTRTISKSYSNVIDDQGDPLALDENIFNGFEVYPNPTQGVINIRITDSSSVDKLLTILDNLGRVVYSEVILGNEMSVDLKDFSPGLYMVQVNSDDSVLFKRVVKK